MNHFPNVIAIAFSMGCFAWMLQSVVQGKGQTNSQERAHVETSVLNPPANSTIAAATSPSSAATAAETLPPPRRPGSDATNRPTGRLARLARRQPFLRPTEPESAEPGAVPPPAATEAIPAPESSEVTLQPAPPIVTDTDHGARRMYRSSGYVQLVMVVKNPADGCLYEIPLCVPSCCTGEPVMNEWCGLFGRGVVEYCWECGFTAKVKFRHILGDVKVEYDG